MDTSKSKLQINTGKSPKVKLGASTSGSASKTTALMPKKDYKKAAAPEMGMPNFGQTGLTGES